MKQTRPHLIGWREWLCLPAIGVDGIKAKIDTGARTSCLHTNDHEEFARGGCRWVRFHLHPLRRRPDIELSCESPIIDYREVKDSGGHGELRPFIRTTARIGDYEWEIDLSLTDREGMKFRMLLGREALSDHFVINPSASYVLGKSLAHEYRKTT